MKISELTKMSNPVIKNWKLNHGSIRGYVYGHQDRDRYPDGKGIETSRIDKIFLIKKNLVIRTVSGSIYRLDQKTGHHVSVILHFLHSHTKLRSL